MYYSASVFVQVAVPVPLGKAFTYSVDERHGPLAVPGARALVEFGRRKVLGVVLGHIETLPPDLPQDRVKPILGIVGDEPALPQELLRFLVDLAGYYIAPIGEVMRLALPAVERVQAVDGGVSELLRAAKVGTVGRVLQFVRRTGNAPETPLRGQALGIYEALAGEEQAVAELSRRFPNARAVVRRLEALALVELFSKASSAPDPFVDAPVQRDEPPVLNEAQSAAVGAIAAAIEEKTGAFLLDGITGSGKTEVYLHAVSACLQQGGGALVLVPEIALTPQLVGRFRARFGDRIAVLHSGLTDGARHQMWRRLRSGELRVAVGARSALFAPLEDLRLICVDEEHDGSYKQEEGVRYHARDMALLRGHRAGATVVLGSATPSLASEALVRRGKLVRLRLPERAAAQATLPRVEVVNLRQVGAGPSGHRLISLPLHRAIEQVLERGKQAILFLNRRGFAPSLVCGACGQIVECPNCAVALTVHRHRGEQLRCHYCDYDARVPDTCSKCSARRLSQEGAGTERIEAVIGEAFPSARVARLDRDVGEGLKSESILARMRAGEIDILVGTQMVTKGHDLPNVALVGVLNADAGLSMPDYQASERTFQLLVQVAGRAGRADAYGHVIVQTRQPEHAAVRFALGHDTASFVAQELAERREAFYPPFARLLLIRLSALDENAVRNAARQVADVVLKRVGRAAMVLGPAPAPIERLRNRYRYRVMVRAKARAPLYEAAKAVLALTQDRRVRLSLDMDPVSML